MLHPLFHRPPATHCPVPRRHTLRAATSALLGLALLVAPPLARAVDANPVITIGTGAPPASTTPPAVPSATSSTRNESASESAAPSRPPNASVSNIQGLKDGRLTLGLVQSDVQYDARKGLGPFRKARS